MVGGQDPESVSGRLWPSGLGSSSQDPLDSLPSIWHLGWRRRPASLLHVGVGPWLAFLPEPPVQMAV